MGEHVPPAPLAGEGDRDEGALAMTAEENVALVRRFVEAQNQRDDATTDALIADDCLVHSWWYNPVQMDGSPAPQGKVMREQMRRNRDRMREQFPEMQMTVDELFAAGDAVTVLTTTQLTRRDGKAVTRKAIAVHRIVAGKIVETWVQWDRLGNFQQLGVVPESAELLRQARS
jgi:ketosteroid isomerase-like protein